MRPLTNPFFLLTVGLVSWLVPGAGYLLLNEKKRAIIIFVTITLTFGIGIYIGSIGVVDPIGAKIAYIGQIMNSPAVSLIGRITAGGGYPVYGRPNEIGQIYTVISGMLNLLCIVNAVYMAHLRYQTPGRRF
jgi:hypothetical protein